MGISTFLRLLSVICSLGISLLPMQCTSYTYRRFPQYQQGSRLIQDLYRARHGSVLLAKKKSRIEKEEASMRKKASKEKLRITSPGPVNTASVAPKPISTIVINEEEEQIEDQKGEDASSNANTKVSESRIEEPKESDDISPQSPYMKVENTEEASTENMPMMKQNIDNIEDEMKEVEEGDVVMVDPLPQSYRTTIQPMRVPRDNPTNTNIPPEVVFFGEVRRPPPIEAARNFGYHQLLLDWARHSPVAPITSEDRLNTVFPKGRLADEAVKYRLDTNGLTYEKIKDKFLCLQDDLEASKAFIAANVDIVPPNLLLRALTAEKLSLQSKKDVENMNRIIDTRHKYIIARDQLLFPMEIEIQKAETRVMTYLARPETVDFAKNWDSVEVSLHMMCLLAARKTWDDQCKEIRYEIEKKLQLTEKYMRDQVEESLNYRFYQDPAYSSYVYGNASLNIEMNMYDEVYVNIRPEIKAIHETYAMTSDQDKKKYLNEILCPREKIDLEQLKEGLLILEASLGALENCDYIVMRRMIRELYEVITNEEESRNYVKWFMDYAETGYGFETYEADNVKDRFPLVEKQQRLRDPGNAFSKFSVEIMSADTKYSQWNQGMRNKGSVAGNWLELDESQSVDVEDIETPDKMLLRWKQAYIETSAKREKDEAERDTKKLGGKTYD